MHKQKTTSINPSINSGQEGGFKKNTPVFITGV